MKPQIKYSEGYKRSLRADYKLQTDIKPHCHLITSGGFAQLGTDGVLHIFKGYAWDGASGPAIDTKNFMRGSLVHDALYQLMAEGMLPTSYRGDADRLLHKICLEDGMSRVRAWWVLKAVRLFGGIAMTKRPTLTAP